MDSPGVVVFESFLYKTPPLDKLIVVSKPAAIKFTVPSFLKKILALKDRLAFS